MQGKLYNQATVLESYGINAERIFRLSKEVKSGDPSNLEAQGARLYWKKFLVEIFGGK